MNEKLQLQKRRLRRRRPTTRSALTGCTNSFLLEFQSFKEENKNKKVSTQDSWITNKENKRLVKIERRRRLKQAFVFLFLMLYSTKHFIKSLSPSFLYSCGDILLRALRFQLLKRNLLPK